MTTISIPSASFANASSTVVAVPITIISFSFKRCTVSLSGRPNVKYILELFLLLLYRPVQKKRMKSAVLIQVLLIHLTVRETVLAFHFLALFPQEKHLEFLEQISSHQTVCQ